VSAQVDKLGSNALLIQPRAEAASGAVTDERLALLTEADGRAIAQQVPAVAHVAPMLGSMEQLVFATGNVNAEVVGTTVAFFEVRAWKPSEGALWDQHAENTGARVCVIGETIREELFGGADPVGRVVRIGRHPFRIIGLMQAKGQD